jgi:hypothetical protein
VSAHAGALEAVDRILNRGGPPGEVLRAVVAALHARVFPWVGIAIERGGELELGPEAGERPPEPALRAAILRQGERVGELQAQVSEESPDDRPLIDRVALLISPQFPGPGRP